MGARINNLYEQLYLTFVDYDIIINFITYYNAVLPKNAPFKNISAIALFKASKSFKKGNRGVRGY